MLTRKLFLPHKVLWYMRVELLFSGALSAAIYLFYDFFDIPKVGLPFSIAATLGGALAIFLGFRNNSAYARWWEARTIWGGIVNSSRNFARLVCTLSDSHAKQEHFQPERTEKFKQSLIYKQVAWAQLLRLQLRKQDNWEEIRPFVSESEYVFLQNKQNKSFFLQKIMADEIYAAMQNGTLAGFDSFQLEGQLQALTNFQGACERIKNTPLLRQYHFFTSLFLYVFMILLPFGLIADFHKIGIFYLLCPVSVLVSFVFATIAKVGEVNENPFENLPTDVPISSLCNTIERDLREILGEKNLPDKWQEHDGVMS